ALRAAAALRQLRNLPFHLIAVEGEPSHYRWLQQHMLDNDIPPEACTLIHGVIGEHRQDVLFYVGGPSGVKPTAWYGQSIIHEYEAVDRSRTASYEGHDVYRLKS